MDPIYKIVTYEVGRGPQWRNDAADPHHGHSVNPIKVPLYGGVPHHTINAYPIYGPRDTIALLYQRMRWQALPENIVAMSVSPLDEETYLITQVRGGQPVVLKDPNNLFPSDTTVTQLRLLIGG